MSGPDVAPPLPSSFEAVPAPVDSRNLEPAVGSTGATSCEAVSSSLRVYPVFSKSPFLDI